MSKKQFYSVTLLICVFVLFTSIPFDFFITNETIVYLLNIILKIGFIIFAIFYIKKEKYKYDVLGKLKCQHLLLFPFILVCFSNLFVCLIDKAPLRELNLISIFQDLLFYLLIAISEELVFRYVLFNEIKANNSYFKAMLFSSLVFGGLHILNITSIASIPLCLVQVLYTFGLGMLLCLIYLYTQNLIVTISFHFLFNFLNDSLASALFEMNWNTNFYLINVIFAIVFIIYGIIIYIFKVKKEIK